jgi:apolipoprotein N-acyltransferase
VAYVSTTGVTSIINKQGLVIKEIPKFKPDILISSISLGSNKTLTQKLGLFPELLSVIMLFLFSVRIRRRN